MTEGSIRLALAGNPNVGKTSLFNGMTGARHKVGNYPGVTVETREGQVVKSVAGGRTVIAVDLPGTYSLTPASEDEAVAYRALTESGDRAPTAVIAVVDASNLARNLYFVLQLRELGLPLVVALNMVDVADTAGLRVDAEALATALGVAVVPTAGRTGDGAAALIQAAVAAAQAGTEARFVPPAGARTREILVGLSDQPARARWLLSARAAETADELPLLPEERRAVAALDPGAADAAAADLVTARYAEVDRLTALCSADVPVADRAGPQVAPTMTRSARIDGVLTHRVWGLLAFVGAMALLFQSIFTWAEPAMDLIETAMGWIGDQVVASLGPGLFTDLLTEGVVSGVGNVIIFLPQIALLFLFVGLLEDSGYLARAAFLMDRLMSRVGLHGRAFVPLLSGYACAIPAIMGTRTISSRRDRIVTILMIPFMSCSARLPIYALVIGAVFEADRPVLGPFTQGGLILLGMYLLSTASALAVGALYKRTILRSPTPPLVLELPPYRMPRIRDTLLMVKDRCVDFLKSAGTVILAFTVVLWALLSFPRDETGAGSTGPTAIERSYGGRAGKAVEPVLTPIGQDWRVGIGIIGSFAAREVLVSTLGLAYGMEAGDDDEDGRLRDRLRAEKDPKTGEPLYTPLSGLALMVFFVYACQCMSTVAVVRRETQSWRWPLFMFGSMTGFAYLAALLVFQLGRALGFG